MSKNVLYALWGGMFILCAGLGFIPEPKGAVRVLLLLAALLFFLPPALLIRRAKKQDDTGLLKLVRNLSALSLLVSMLALILNIVGATGSETAGRILHYFLVVVSSPMICSGSWALSLFLWACLLMVCLKLLKSRK